MAGIFPPELLAQIDVDRMAFYEVFDELIERREMQPFIFVQPDGSLHLPHLNNAFDFFTGQFSTKGSFYINSASTGKFGDYIAHDVIDYIDSHFRTIADSRRRAIAGASMGGYGTLCLCMDYPGKFSAAAALSPGNFTIDSVPWRLHIPLMEKLLGKERADKADSETWDDILDSVDLVYAPGRRLLPTIRKDGNGRVLEYDQEAAQRWDEHDINILIARNPGIFKKIPLQVNCSRDDEFSLAGEAAKLHLTLQQLRINHEFDFYSDPAAALSPHILGIAYRVMPAIRFCLRYIS
jgi:S-formylglutathione hydrolase FrmB